MVTSDAVKKILTMNFVKNGLDGINRTYSVMPGTTSDLQILSIKDDILKMSGRIYNISSTGKFKVDLIHIEASFISLKDIYLDKLVDPGIRANDVYQVIKSNNDEELNDKLVEFGEFLRITELLSNCEFKPTNGAKFNSDAYRGVMYKPKDDEDSKYFMTIFKTIYWSTLSHIERLEKLIEGGRND